MILLLGILLVLLASIAFPWSLIVLLVAAVLEIGEIALLRRWAKRLDRRTKATTGAEAMIGKQAEVVMPCRPDGTVRIGGELWEARCAVGADRGDAVEVKGVDGLTLLVAP